MVISSEYVAGSGRGDAATATTEQLHHPRSPQQQLPPLSGMRPLDDDFEELEDGELPSLQLKTASRDVARVVTPVARTTTASSHDVQQQQRFWKQLEDDDRDDPFDDDIPEDERAAMMKEEKSRMTETIELNDSEDHHDNFCGTALQAIGEICGNFALDMEPKHKVYRSESPSRARSPPNTAKKDDDEATAIEIEFLEPEQAKPVDPAAKKNAVLSAMARKAKADFVATKKNPTVDEDEDVYGGFTDNEKRRFLMLINAGESPADATAQILHERQPESDEEEIDEDMAQTTTPTVSRKTRAARLAFWKKKKNGGSSAGPDEADDKPEQLNKTYPLTDAEDSPASFARSGINYYDAVRREDIPGSEEDDDDDDIASGRKRSKQQNRARYPRARGFAALRDKRAVSAPHDRPSPPEDREPTAMYSPNSVEIESALAGTLAVPVDASPSSTKNASRGVLKGSPNTSATITQSDLDALDRIERELLRPTTIRSQDETLMAQAPRLRRDLQVRPQLRPTGKMPVVNIKEEVEDDVSRLIDMNMDMDTYMHSTEEQTVMNDAASVYTMGTGASGATMSTRTRRPGVAKSRLAMTKMVNAKKNGWHETIQEAARSTGKVWKPEVGWVDYEDPNKTTVGTNNEKIHVNLKRPQNGKTTSYINESGETVAVPFPPEWEAERNAMLQSVTNISATSESTATGPVIALRKVDDQALLGSATSQSFTPDVVDFGPITQDISTLETQADDEADIEVQADHGHSVYRDLLDADDAQSRGSRPAQSVASEKYVQLGETGSVRSFNKGPASAKLNVNDLGSNYISDDDEEDCNEPLLSQESSGFPSPNERVISPVVGVVTEKVGEEELGLFPSTGKHTRAARQNTALDDSDQKSEGPSLLSTGSSRRGAGPVDTDEVDETWDSDDEKRFSSRWEGDAIPVDTSKSFDSKSTSSSLPRTKVPRLKGSKKDTAPVHRLSGKTSRGGSTISANSINEGRITPEPTRTYDAEVFRAAIAYDDDEAKSRSVEEIREQWELRAAASQEKDPVTPSKSVKQYDRSFDAKEPPGQKSFYQAKDRIIRASESEDDSLFNFEETSKQSTPDRKTKSALESTDLSPIRGGDDEDDEDDEDDDIQYGSEAYGPDEEGQKSFFKRLAECAAPVMPRDPSALCGRPEAVQEVHEEDSATTTNSKDEGEHRPKRSQRDTRSASIPRSRADDLSSVVSEDQGRKTAYLESLAMKTAVAKPRSGSRSRGRSSTSSVASSAASSQHSEKWKAFLERKRVTTNGASTRATESDISKAASQYTSTRLKDMMSRSQSAPRPGRDSKKFEESTKRSTAADDLAAARVEAMMAALTRASQNDSAGEI